MTTEDEWGDECFFCDACGKRFRTPLYDISREFEQTFFYQEPRSPEIEVLGAESIANYCSASCREQKRDELLHQERVRATFPGIGPVESCSRCGGAVDMTKLHLTYVQMNTTQDWDRLIADVLDAQTLAVVCQDCHPVPSSIATADSSDEEMKVKATNELVHER